MNDDPETPSSVATALAMVAMLAFTGAGLKLLNDQCLIQTPSLPQFGGKNGSPTLIDETKTNGP